MNTSLSNKLRSLNAQLLPGHNFLAPKWLVLGVNNNCNLHCKMCDVGVNYSQSNFFENLMGSKPTHMPPDLLTRIIQQSARCFPKTKIGIGFTEPLIYKHLVQALELIRSENLYGSITTNGLGLAKWAKAMTEYKLDALNISLDGPEDVHNFIRGNPYSYRVALEGIKELRNQNDRTEINVYCVITEWNTGRLVEFVNGLGSYKLSKIGLIHPNFTSHEMTDRHNELFGSLYPATESNISETNYDNIDLKLLFEEIQLLKKSKHPISFFPDLSSPESLHTYYKLPAKFVGKRCLDIFSSMMIKSNGDCIPAHGRCFNHTIGNIYNEDLDQIWNSAKFSSFRKVVSNAGGLLPACSRCCGGFGS